MRIKKLFLCLAALCGVALQAQERKQLSLDEAIAIAVTKSTEASLAETRVITAGLNVANVKNNIYPEMKVSGQYMRLNQPTVNLKFPMGGNDEPAEEGETTSSPTVNQLMLAQANLSMPLFSGFRLKNSIEASESLLNAEKFRAAGTKEKLAMQTIVLYVNLYKAQQSVSLMQENIKSAHQRVTDFTAMEQNGLLARNDLLKAQLQESSIQLSMEEAKKTVSTLNFQLVTLLKLPEGTIIEPNDNNFKNNNTIAPAASVEEAIAQRNDLEAIRWQQKAQEANVKVAKADYYPSLALTGGYIALDVHNFLQVYNAVNVGVGVSYDISGIFKNGKKVKAEKSRAEEVRQQAEILTDRVKVEVQEAIENYNLALKQNHVYTQAVEQATENYRIVNDKYDNGLSDTNDLLEADVQQLQAKINEAFSKADITQRYYELLKATGKLTNTFNLTQNN